MPEKNKLAPRPLSDWETTGWRVTTFHPLDGFKDLSSEWWLELAGMPPSSATIAPGQNVARQEGRVEGAVLALQFQLGKIDLIMKPALDQAAVEPRLPSLGKVDDSLAQAVSFGKKLMGLGGLPPAIRVAIGANFILPAEGRIAAYENLGRYIPVETDGETSSHILYQVNRAREVTFEGKKIKVNRLSKWSCSEITFEIPQTSAKKISYVSALELDISTPKEGDTPLTEDILSVLTNMAQEICEKGDIP